MARAEEAPRALAQHRQSGPQHSHRCPGPPREVAALLTFDKPLKSPSLLLNLSKQHRDLTAYLAHLSCRAHVVVHAHKPLLTGSLGSLPSHHPPIYLCVPQEQLGVSPVAIPRHDEQRAALPLLQAPLPFSFTPHAFLFLHPTYICKLHLFLSFKTATFYFFKESFSTEVNPLKAQPPAQLDEILFAATAPYKHHRFKIHSSPNSSCILKLELILGLNNLMVPLPPSSPLSP